MPSPSTNPPVMMTGLGPIRSTMKPRKGAKAPVSTCRRENAPESAARDHPNSRRIGRKKTWKPCQ